MNGLNSLGLHVGVELIFLLAEVIGVLKELSCDWSDGLGGCGRTLSMVEVGYFVTMFIVDISVGLPWVWVRSGEPFTTAARGFAAPDRVSHHPKPEKAHKTSERNLLLYIFFLSQTFFLFVWLFVCFLKVTACVNERPCHFLLTTYLRFCVAFARLCSISKDLLARWKAQQRQRSHKGKRDACVVKFPRGIFSLTGETTDWVLFWLSESERKKGGTKRKEKKERERESSECCLWFARRSRDCSGSDGSASLFFSPFSLPGSARLVSPPSLSTGYRMDQHPSARSCTSRGASSCEAVPTEPSMNLYIHSTTGTRFELSLPLEETVEGLKRRLSQRLKVPKERLALLHKETWVNTKEMHCS